MRIVKIGNRYRIRDFLPRVENFWIDVDPQQETINVPATGDIGKVSASDLSQAILYAIGLASGLVSVDVSNKTERKL